VCVLPNYDLRVSSCTEQPLQRQVFENNLHSLNVDSDQNFVNLVEVIFMTNKTNENYSGFHSVQFYVIYFTF